MRRNKVISLTLAGALLCALCVTGVTLAGRGGGSAGAVDEPYAYTVVPGTQAWAELDSLDAKIAACAVPQERMEAMTTSALLETVLDYPLLVNLWAYDTLEEGVASVSGYFGGVPLLLGRPDGAECIRTALEDTRAELALMSDLSSEAYQAALLREGYLEALLAQAEL